MDVARYADSNGYEHDFDRPNAWRYRDYVIASFNKDTPYDVFLKEQLAGDEMEQVSNERLIATAFLRNYAKVGFRDEGQSAISLRLSRRHDRHIGPRHYWSHRAVRALPRP